MKKIKGFTTVSRFAPGLEFGPVQKTVFKCIQLAGFNTIGYLDLSKCKLYPVNVTKKRRRKIK